MLPLLDAVRALHTTHLPRMAADRNRTLRPALDEILRPALDEMQSLTHD